MRYFIDTEFFEDGRTIDLLSIGIVAEDGREYYAESSDADLSKADPWVRENVFVSMNWRNQKTRHMIAAEVRGFCNPIEYGKPEFWAYYADYDWVAVCQLFGRMIELPTGWPMYCRDFKQMLDERGNPGLTKLPEAQAHNALSDARWLRAEFFRFHARVANAP